MILLVEDNEDHALLIQRNLEKIASERKVVHLSDGEQAINFLHSAAKEDPKPALILLDLRLPRVDGIEVLREIKNTSALQSIPVIILTTSSADDDMNRAYDLRANSYLVKPADFGQFKSLMHDLGEYWLEWNRTPE